MDKEKMKEKVEQLMEQGNLASDIEFIDLYIQCLFDIVKNHQKDKVETQEESDAKMILQMLFSKLIHLRKILEDVSFVNKEGVPLIANIIDPTVVASYVRGIYEQVCLFNLIYGSAENDEKRKIVYSLWVSAGLSYRQKFAASAKQPESIKKYEEEEEKIREIKKWIEETQTYKGLDEKNQGKIQSRLKIRDFKVKIEGGEVRVLNWQEISKEFITKSAMFDDIYTYFSLYAHPSYVSIFQFGEMFKKEDMVFKRITSFNLKFCVALMSVFLGDYIRLFPAIKSTYEDRTEVDQILLNFYNRMLRGDEKSISEVWKML